jgi:hypothetical protein
MGKIKLGSPAGIKGATAKQGQEKAQEIAKSAQPLTS